MIEARIDLIRPDDLHRLNTNGVPEGRSLEYKEALPAGTDAERKEFLADVSSFANATGGDLLYGLKEARDPNGKATGLIDAVEGLTVSNRDAEIQRLENMLRDGIAPRIPGVRLRWVDGFPRGPVLVVRIPRSWAGPHMIVYQQSSRFYSRNANGKYLLDVFELRNAFLGSGSLSERAREFRAERLGRICADDAPVALSSAKFVCVHAIPHAGLAGGVAVDIERAAGTEFYSYMSPLGSTGYDRTIFNLDGLLAYNSVRDSDRRMSYLQLFRNGIVESIDAAAIENPSKQHGDGIGSGAFGPDLFGFIRRVQRLWRALEVEPPASILVSLLGVKGARLFVNPELTGRHTGLFDRDRLLLPDLMLVDFEGDASAQIKPLMDTLWQAADFARCMDYNEAGVWIGDRR
jgi:hypothetical protein